MTEDSFWNLIAFLEGTADSHSTARLTTLLTSLPPAEIESFAVHLASSLYALDDPRGADQEIYDSSTGEPVELSDDLFLYLRCAVVAKGRNVWSSAVADPSSLAGSWNVFDSEFLLYVAPKALEAATGATLDYATSISYETGSNSQLWERASNREKEQASRLAHTRDSGGMATPIESMNVARRAIPHRPWLMIEGAAEVSLPWHPLYFHVRNALMIAVNADAAWTSWWNRASKRDLNISIRLAPEGEWSIRLKKGRLDVNVDIITDGRFLLGTDRREFVSRAHQHVKACLEDVGERLALGATPLLPRIPELPKTIDLDAPDTPANPLGVWPTNWPGFETNWI